MTTDDERLQFDSVCVVVPIRNMAGRLSYVQRLMDNDFIEMILAEDSSTDETYEDLLSLGRKSKCMVNILTGNFGGPGPARNAGLNICTSSYVAFFDSDDESFGGAELNEMLTLAMETGADVVIGSFEVLDMQTSVLHRHDADANLQESLRQIPGIWRLLFRREFLVSNNICFADLRMGEDLLFLLDCYLHKPRIAVLNRCVYRYRVGQMGQSTRSADSLMDLRRLLSMLESRYQDCTEASSRALISFIWLKTLGSTIRRLKGKVLVSTISDILKTTLRSPILVMSALFQIPNLLFKRVPLMSRTSRVKD